MNLFLTSNQSMSDVFKSIEEALKIHSKVTIYYQGREIGTILSPNTAKCSINNHINTSNDLWSHTKESK